jgi:hypothetical protein
VTVFLKKEGGFPVKRTGLLLCLFLGAALTIGCTSGPSGTYSDTMGSVILELKSGGKANITFMGEVADCTDSTSGNQLTLDCKGQAGKIVFTIHDDGSLTGPPGGFMPALRKQK